MINRNTLALVGLGLLMAGYVWRVESRAAARGGKDSPTASSSSPQVVVHEHRYVQVNGNQAAQVKGGDAPKGDPNAPDEAPREPKRPFDPEERKFQLETAYDEDAAPTATSRKRETTIRTAFSSPSAKGSTLKSLECKASRCRMEVEFDDMQADKRVIHDVLMETPGIDMAGSVPERKTGPDGKVTAVIHLFPMSTAPRQR